MSETTTTDSAELADLLVDLARYANSVAAQCRDLATTRGDLHITNQYGLVAGQSAEAAGRAVGWARQLRDSHAIIVGHWPQSDEGRRRREADCSGPEDQVTPFDEVGPDDVLLADDHPLGAVSRVLNLDDEWRDEAHDATWSDRDDDRDEEVRS